MSDVVFYDYWGSSASYRVRIALNLAKIPYQAVSIDLIKETLHNVHHFWYNLLSK
jgi:maleylacetoacetate isomerase